MIRPSMVSIHLNEYLCHCSCSHGEPGTSRSTYLLVALTAALIKDYYYLLGDYSLD